MRKVFLFRDVIIIPDSCLASKFCTTWPFSGESTDDWWIPSKRPCEYAVDDGATLWSRASGIFKSELNNKYFSKCPDDFPQLYSNKANLRDLIAATGLVILLKLDSNLRFFSPCELEIRWMTLKNNRAPLLYYIKLCASFQIHRWIQIGNAQFRSKSAIFGPMSINQSNPVLLKERVRIPRTRRVGGAAMLWGAFPLDGVGSCRLFFTDDLHDTLSWVPASDKPHTFKSCFTHSSQVFFGRPGPFLPGTGLDLTLFISPLERMTCPNHLSRRSRTRTARSHIPSLACRSSIDGSSDSLTPQIQRIIARSLRHSRWRASEVMGQVSVPCNIELRTLELNRQPLRSKGTGLGVSKGRFSWNLPQAHLHLAVAAAIQPPPALSMSPR